MPTQLLSANPRPKAGVRVGGRVPITAALTMLSAAYGVWADTSKAGDKVQLRRKFAATQVTYYVVEREESSRQVVSLIPIPIAMRRVMTDAWIERVRSINGDGTTTIDWTLDRAQYQRLSERNPYKYDSVSDEPNQESRPIFGLVNRPLAVRQKPAGTATPMHDAPAWQAPTTQAASKAPDLKMLMGPPAPGQYSNPTPAPRVSNMPFYDAEEVQRLLSRLASDFLPAHPVIVGDSWDVTFTENKTTVGTILHRLRYTFKELVNNDGVAVIEVQGDCGLDADKAASASESGDRKVTVRKGRWAGEVRFDVARGRVQSLSLRHENDISSEMKGKDDLVVELTMAEERLYRMRSTDEPPAKPIVVKAAKVPATGMSQTAQQPVARTPASQPWRRPYRFNQAGAATQAASTAPTLNRPRAWPPQATRPGKYALMPGEAYPPPSTQRVRPLGAHEVPASHPLDGP